MEKPFISKKDYYDKFLNKKKETIFNTFYGKETVEVYSAFKEIENDIEDSNYLLEYFDEIVEMLSNDKSYIKIRGFRIICKLAKWDVENKIDKVIDLMLNILDDSKPTIVRMSLEALSNLIIYKKKLSPKIKSKVSKIDYLKFKDSMSPLIKKDIDRLLQLL